MIDNPPTEQDALDAVEHEIVTLEFERQRRAALVKDAQFDYRDTVRALGMLYDKRAQIRHERKLAAFKR